MVQRPPDAQHTIDGFELRVRIPPNCRATVLLPDGSSREVVAGEHEFNLPLDVLVDDGIPVLRELSDLESKAG